MMLSKMCITKGINLWTEDKTTTATTATTTEEDQTEVEEEAEATEEEFWKDTRIQLILVVTFPDVESIGHWEDDCPDNPYGKSKGNTEEVVLY